MVKALFQVRPAGDDDLPGIRELVASVGGDLDNLQAGQFVVAQDEAGNIVGCGRLKPYPAFIELASIVVKEEWQVNGVGRQIVSQLLERHSGPIYLICENNVVDFFRRFGFAVVPLPEAPADLIPKWRHYVTLAGHINVMRRLAS